MKRRTVAVCTATALSVTVLGTVVAGSAQAEPATPMTYPAGAAGTRFSGFAFDVCEAPSANTMRAWKSSPYKAIGIYISGFHRACDQKKLTRDWVRDVSALGWKLIPLDVSLQAPCADNKRLKPMSTNPGKATAQGKDAAKGAVRAAAALGILPGSALYSDIESYSPAKAKCGKAVLSYWSGWTRELHKSGYLSGVYGSVSSAVRGLAGSYSSTDYARPDAVWSAEWDGKAKLDGWSGVPNRLWPGHQRIKQFRGDGQESFGGVTLLTDRNIIDAPVATVAYTHRVTATMPQAAVGAPFATAQALGAPLPGGATVQVVCQVRTTVGIWNKLHNGTYLPDAAVDGGSPKPLLPTCAVPFQVTAENLNLRAGPSKTSAPKGTIGEGALAWVNCESPGITLGRPGYWQMLDSGGFISGAFVATQGPGKRTVGVPLCTG